MARSKVAVKDPNGAYVRAIRNKDGGYTLVDVATDIGGNGATFMSAADYEMYMLSEHAGWTWSEEETSMRVRLAIQEFNLPVTVLNRQITQAEFLFNDKLEKVYVDSDKYSTETTTYVGVDALGNRNDGRYIEITNDKSTGLPEEILYYNRFAYLANAGLANSIRLTFASGDSFTYYVDFEGMPTFAEVAENPDTIKKVEDKTKKQDNRVTVHVYSDKGCTYELMSFKVDVVIRASALSVNNSDVTYNDMSVGDYKYQVSPYDSETNSLYNLGKYDKSVNYYVGGTYITAYDWWNDGRSVGEGGSILVD